MNHSIKFISNQVNAFFSLFTMCHDVKSGIKVARDTALCFTFFFLSFSLTANAQSGRRKLTVSLYPYIPNPDNFYRKVEKEFEKKYPQIDLIVNLNQDSYYDGILSEEADVYEIDCILLKEFIKKQKIQKLTPNNFKFKQDDLMPATNVTTIDKKLYAVPHWLCGNFLFSRSSDTAMAGISKLNDLAKLITTDPSLKEGLNIDLKGELGLGEMYVDALFDLYHDIEKVKQYCTLATIDQTALANLNKLPQITYNDWGRNKAYHKKGYFYSTQFAKGNGRACVGYSEALYDMLREINFTCSTEDNCTNANGISINDFAFSDDQATPVGWVDALAIKKSLKGQKLNDAKAFLNFMISKETYYMALIPDYGSAPRYLLPAYKQYYSDDSVTNVAPYYKKLFPLALKLTSFTKEGIYGDLDKIGSALDTIYLKN